MRRALAITVLLCSGCFKPEPKESVDFGHTSPVAGAEALPTPEPPPEGAWSLAVESTEDGCGLAAPPEVVYLAGDGHEWQIALQPFFLDATGVLAGEKLDLEGTARVVYRPTVDCIVRERDEWQLTRTAPETLAGEVARVREVAEGDACAEATSEGIELPCVTRWRVRLDHRSAKRAPSTARRAEPPPEEPAAP